MGVVEVRGVLPQGGLGLYDAYFETGERRVEVRQGAKVSGHDNSGLVLREPVDM